MLSAVAVIIDQRILKWKMRTFPLSDWNELCDGIECALMDANLITIFFFFFLVSLNRHLRNYGSKRTSSFR